MKKRTINYLKKSKAFKVFTHAADADLFTLLNASLELSKNRIVKNHIMQTMQTLNAA